MSKKQRDNSITNREQKPSTVGVHTIADEHTTATESGSKGAIDNADDGGGGSDGQGRRSNGDVKPRRDIFQLGIYLAILSVVLLVATLALWPRTDLLPKPKGDGSRVQEDTIQPLAIGSEAVPQSASAGEESSFENGVQAPSANRILLLVVVVGMLGSVIGAISSFVSYVGNETFKASWLWWYLLRPLMGSMLGLLLYLVAQAGFLDSPSAALDEGKLEKLIYQAVAIAGLAGMFSKVTADKLEQIFATILQSSTDDSRKDKLKRNDDSQ